MMNKMALFHLICLEETKTVPQSWQNPIYIEQGSKALVQDWTLHTLKHMPITFVNVIGFTKRVGCLFSFYQSNTCGVFFSNPWLIVVVNFEKLWFQLKRRSHWFCSLTLWKNMPKCWLYFECCDLAGDNGERLKNFLFREEGEIQCIKKLWREYKTHSPLSTSSGDFLCILMSFDRLFKNKPSTSSMYTQSISKKNADFKTTISMPPPRFLFSVRLSLAFARLYSCAIFAWCFSRPVAPFENLLISTRRQMPQTITNSPRFLQRFFHFRSFGVIHCIHFHRKIAMLNLRGLFERPRALSQRCDVLWNLSKSGSDIEKRWTFTFWTKKYAHKNKACFREPHK